MFVNAELILPEPAVQVLTAGSLPHQPGEMWALLDSCCLNMGHWASNHQKIEDDDHSNAETRQGITIKSLETRQQAGETCFTPTVTFNCGQLAVHSILSRQKCNKNRAWAQAGSVLLTVSKTQDLHWPQTQQWGFPREAPAGEDTAEFYGGMNVFHLKMGVGSCQKGVSISSQENHCQYFSATWHDPLSLFQRKLLSCLHPSMW